MSTSLFKWIQISFIGYNVSWSPIESVACPTIALTWCMRGTYKLGIKMDHLKPEKMAGLVKCWLCSPELSSDPRGIGKARHSEWTSVTPALRSDGRWRQENALKLWGNQPGIHHNNPVADKVEDKEPASEVILGPAHRHTQKRLFSGLSWIAAQLQVISMGEST